MDVTNGTLCTAVRAALQISVCVEGGSACVMMMMKPVTPRADADQRRRRDSGWGSSTISSSIPTSIAATKRSSALVEARLSAPPSRVLDAPARRQDVRILGPAPGAPRRARGGVLGSVWQPAGRHQLLQKAMPAHRQKQKPRESKLPPRAVAQASSAESASWPVSLRLHRAVRHLDVQKQPSAFSIEKHRCLETNIDRISVFMWAHNAWHRAGSVFFSLHPLGCYKARLGRNMNAADFLLHLKTSPRSELHPSSSTCNKLRQ